MEIFGAAGFDYIAIDTEHAGHSPVTVRAMHRKPLPGTAAVAIVRLLRLNAGEIGRFLDLGAAGVLCPFVNTAAEAAELVAGLPVSAARESELGAASRRRIRPRERRLRDGLRSKSLICLAMIETAEAVANIDEIVAVDGLTGVIVGPIDLSISLGARRDYDSERYVESVARVRAACLAASPADGSWRRGSRPGRGVRGSRRSAAARGWRRPRGGECGPGDRCRDALAVSASPAREDDPVSRSSGPETSAVTCFRRCVAPTASRSCSPRRASTPTSSGIARARDRGIATSVDGAAAVFARDDVDLVFEATSAAVHKRNAPDYALKGLRVIDLTPAKLGVPVVPAVNGGRVADEMNFSLISCGAQATVPIVAAVASVAPIGYAEIVATIASLSAGHGTRQNIDEFTRTTASALESVGGAGSGKAIIILNPASPPIHMRNTVFALVPQDADEKLIRDAVRRMEERVRIYVPGYKIVAGPEFDPLPEGGNARHGRDRGERSR